MYSPHLSEASSTQALVRHEISFCSTGSTIQVWRRWGKCCTTEPRPQSAVIPAGLPHTQARPDESLLCLMCTSTRQRWPETLGETRMGFFFSLELPERSWSSSCLDLGLLATTVARGYILFRKHSSVQLH